MQVIRLGLVWCVYFGHTGVIFDVNYSRCNAL